MVRSSSASASPVDSRSAQSRCGASSGLATAGSSGYQSISRMVSVTNHALRYTALAWCGCLKFRSQKLTTLA